MLILSAVLALLVYGMIAAFLGTILPDLSTRFKLTPSQNGTIASAQALGLILASLVTGPLMDAQGKKVILVLGLALVAGALLLLPRAGGFGTIAALLFVLGIGGGTIVNCGNALASDVGEAHRAIALNLVNLFFGLGGLITPFLSANLFRQNTARLGYTIAGLTVLALLIQIATRIPGPTGDRSFVFAEVGPMLGRPVLLMLGLVLFLYVSCEVGMWNWLTQHLIAQGIAPSRALNILSLGFALGLLLGRLGVSPILMRVSPLAVIMASSILITITTLLILRTTDARQAWILVFLAGISMAPVFPTTLAVVANVSPRMTGTAIGFAVTCGWIGLAVSSRIIGAIAGGDTRRLRRALLVIPVFSVLMFALNVAILLSLR